MYMYVHMYAHMYRTTVANAASSPSSGGCKPSGGENTTGSKRLCWVNLRGFRCHLILWDSSPLVNVYIANGKSTFLMEKSTISMAISH